MRFEGTENYVATDDLRVAVNAAIELERPLLIKGEPWNRQDGSRHRSREGPRLRADRMAHQVDHQGRTGPLRV